MCCSRDAAGGGHCGVPKFLCRACAPARSLDLQGCENRDGAADVLRTYADSRPSQEVGASPPGDPVGDFPSPAFAEAGLVAEESDVPPAEGPDGGLDF